MVENGYYPKEELRLSKAESLAQGQCLEVAVSLHDYTLFCTIPRGPCPLPILTGWTLTHVVAHESDADGHGVPEATRVVTLEVPAPALIHEPVFSNQEAAWGWGGGEGG